MSTHKRPCPPTCGTPMVCDRIRAEHARLTQVLAGLTDISED